MGMFDNISVSDVLPFTQEMKDLGLDINNHSWQTKDLCNCLSQYFIQGGRLFEQKFKVHEFVEGNPKSQNFADKLGYMKKEDPYLEPVYHHGEIYFYDFIEDVQDKWDCWVEFKAIFTNGGLDRYQLVKFEKKDNTERKQKEIEWKDQLTRENNRFINKYFLHTKPMIWFSMKIWYPACTGLANFFFKLAHKI